VHEVVVQPHYVRLVVRVRPRVQQVEDADLHPRLVVVRRVALDDLDGHQLAALQVATLDHLAEGAGTEEGEDLVAAAHQGTSAF